MLTRKKAQFSSPFVMIISALVLGIILVFGFLAVFKLMGTIKDAQLTDFLDKFEQDMKKASVKKGSMVFTYEIPENINRIIIIDSSNTQALLRNKVVKSNPLVYDVISSGEKKNFFLIDNKDNLVKTVHIGDVSLGKISDQLCTGIGVIEPEYNGFRLRMTNKPGMDLFLGDECDGMRYNAFAPPFDSSVISSASGDKQYLEISSSGNSIMLNKNRFTSADPYQDIYYSNGSFFSDSLGLSSIYDLDRLYYSADTSANNDVLFRIGFKKSGNGWEFFGPNLSAKKTDDDYYYSYPGQYITEPSFNYDSVKVKGILFSDEDNLTTPIFNWLKISYFR